MGDSRLTGAATEGNKFGKYLFHAAYFHFESLDTAGACYINILAVGYKLFYLVLGQHHTKYVAKSFV